jgi:hypothetical protein
MFCKVLKRRPLALVYQVSYKRTAYKYGSLSKIQIRNPFQEYYSKIEIEALEKV